MLLSTEQYTIFWIIFYLHRLYKHHAYEEMEASDNFLVGIVFD